ncbi:ATP-binding cassette domain-containing protein [bacterium]|nr:ATP-binding cassette domain-containing protein [bacterium]
MSSTTKVSSGVRLDVSGLNRSYDGRPVLKDIQFHVEPGEVFVIMGPSGSGKSVLIKHLIGLEAPDTGDIRVRDRFRMAMVFQSGALLSSLTVGQNVGLYLTEHRLKSPDEIREVVKKNLALVGLKDVEDQYPAQLSGGMKKRVAIARALIIEPHLIFYDEPTSELDPLMATVVGKEIAKLNQRTGVTSVVVTHDRELALGIASRIAIIRDGEILLVGTPDSLKQETDPFIQEFLLASQHPPTSITPTS